LRETIEIRLADSWVLKQLGSDIGKDLGGSVRVIELEREDPKIQYILELINSREKELGKRIYKLFHIRRYYSSKELENAEILRLIIAATFEPAGMDLGTLYEEICSKCGLRIQKSELILDLRKIRRCCGESYDSKYDIAKTISYDEWVVSERFKRIVEENQITGCEFLPVRHYSKRAKNLPTVYQLKVTSSVGETAEQTKFGKNPFDLDPEGKFRCPEHNVSGLNIVSELYIKRENWDGSDIAITRNLIGGGAANAYPMPLIIISQKFYRLLKENKMKGFKVEVAHLV
jgi:predicted hydrocarbon binding protein